MSRGRWSDVTKDGVDYTALIDGEFRGLLIDQLIGGGISRKVYSIDLTEEWVVKIEDPASTDHFQNVAEWNTWCDIWSTPHAKWFAKCHSISPCGTVLIQQRTTHCSKWPSKVPAFWDDLQKRNYGLVGKQLVAHDYGFTRRSKTGLTSRMVNAKWIDR